MCSTRLLKTLFLMIAVLATASAAASAATLTYGSSWTTENPSIYVARDDGTHRQLLFEGQPDLLAGNRSYASPDGRLVAFARELAPNGPYWLSVTPARGGATRALVQDADFLAWSPDSRTIAAVVSRPEEIQGQRILLIDVTTGGVRTLVDTADVKGASFSPRGDQLAYAAGRGLASGLYTIPVTGGDPITMDDGHRSQWPVWGKSWIAFTRWQQTAKRPELALVKTSGTMLREITHTYIPYIRPVAWSANGRRLLLEITRPTSPYAATFDLHSETIRHVADGRHGHPGMFPYAISRDGGTILGTSGSLARPGGLNVVTMPFKGGRLTTLVRHATDPSWSR